MRKPLSSNRLSFSRHNISQTVHRGTQKMLFGLQRSSTTSGCALPMDTPGGILGAPYNRRWRAPGMRSHLMCEKRRKNGIITVIIIIIIIPIIVLNNIGDGSTIYRHQQTTAPPVLSTPRLSSLLSCAPRHQVKSRMQNQLKIEGQVQKYNYALPSLVTVASDEGVAAIYK